MYFTHPTLHLIAETTINQTGVDAYLSAIGADNWMTDECSDIEEIIEVLARGCYKSFGTELNTNLTKTREGNQLYLKNILESKHGSVLEHAWVSFQLCNISRVFTHELCRNRAGTAISQESLRFVKLENMGCWIPPCFQNDEDAKSIFKTAFSYAEAYYGNLLAHAAKKEGKEWNDLSFSIKKKYTSAARRVAPIGLATNMGWSCNMRALRHIIEQRTHPAAEEEIRYVFGKIAEVALARWPHLFQDFTSVEVDGLLQYLPSNSKI